MVTSPFDVRYKASSYKVGDEKKGGGGKKHCFKWCLT